MHRDRYKAAFLFVVLILRDNSLFPMDATANIVSGPNVDDCHFPGRPNAIFGVWIPGMVFDCLVLSLTAWNACARPRTQKTPLTTALYQDGIAVFLILAGLRAINLFLTIFSQVFLIGICIVWPLSAITLSRFIFKLHRLEKEQTAASNSSHIDFENAYTDSKQSSMLEVPHIQSEVQQESL